MFIGRSQELSSLNRRYASGKFEFVVLYGRRRVGKTELIREFIKDKPAIYFMAVERNARQNLEALSACVTQQLGGTTGSVYPDFLQALRQVFEHAQKRRLVLVIDEYPYLASCDKSLASTLQKLIDEYQERSKLMLILCGSSMSYMEKEVMAYRAPLYGRRTAQIRLEPFEFHEACGFCPHVGAMEKALFYGICGGTPRYLKLIDDTLSFEENLCRMYLDPDSSLVEEPESFLRLEFREPKVYASIMHALAGGASRLADISTKVGIPSGNASVHLNSLIELGIVKRETPYGERFSKRPLYRIADNMFAFWYRFVDPNLSLITRRAEEAALHEIMPQLSDHMGHVFEEICMQYLWRQMLSGKLPQKFRDLGRWWGNDPTARCQTEIDIMGDDGKESAVFGECKWTNEKVDVAVLKLLQHRSGLFNYGRKQLFIFAKNGFTDACIKTATDAGNVTLVSYLEVLENLS